MQVSAKNNLFLTSSDVLEWNSENTMFATDFRDLFAIFARRRMIYTNLAILVANVTEFAGIARNPR